MIPNFEKFWQRSLFSVRVLVCLVVASTLPQSAAAHEYVLGTLLIEHPAARPTAPVARNGAVFLRISDEEGTGDTLLTVSTPASAKAEMHLTTITDNVARMQRQESVSIPAGGAVDFEPGGLHIMLMGLEGPLVKGEKIPLTLNFKKAGSIVVDVKIEDHHEHESDDATSTDAHKSSDAEEHHGHH